LIRRKGEDVKKSILLAGSFSVLACTGNGIERAQLAATCASAGDKAFDRYKSELVVRYGSLTPMLDKPEFHFNSRLNTCLMKVGHWSTVPGTERRPGTQDSDLLNEVIDVYANKTVISGGHENRFDLNGKLQTNLIGTNPLDFNEKAKTLMTE
jgi:hypothetical protein